MPGYKNRILPLDFPTISDEDDPIWVKVKNPKLVPAGFWDEFSVSYPPEPNLAGLDPESAATVQQEHDRIVVQKATKAMHGMTSLIIDSWHVYDVNDTSDEPQPLGLPATPEMVASLPSEIRTTISKLISDARNPQ